MLSRVAESLYWMARYIERAEAVSRVAAVNFQALLDGGGRGGWDGVVRITGDLQHFRSVCPESGEKQILEFLLSHPRNPNAVLACLSRARENALGVRDQITGEMWEHLNRLYLLARDGNALTTAESPYRFFCQVRDGSQAFEGIAAATLTHGEAYYFILLGRYLERAALTVRTLGVRYEEIRPLEEGTAAASLEMMALLKSCSAFEPFRRQHGSQLQASRVAEFLLLSPSFPRAVLFCLNRGAAAVGAVVGSPARRPGEKQDVPGRLLGRLGSELSYLDVEEVLGDGLCPFLDGLLRKIDQVGDEITRTYFNTRVILPAKWGSGQVQQQQQQQQARRP